MYRFAPPLMFLYRTLKFTRIVKMMVEPSCVGTWYRNMPLPGYFAKFGLSTSYGSNIRRELCPQIGPRPLDPAFQGNSRSLKVKRFDRVSNYEPIIIINYYHHHEYHFIRFTKWYIR